MITDQQIREQVDRQRKGYIGFGKQNVMPTVRPPKRDVLVEAESEVVPDASEQLTYDV